MIYEFKLLDIWDYVLEENNIQHKDVWNYDTFLTTKYNSFIDHNFKGKIIEFKCIEVLHDQNRVGLITNYNCYAGEHKGKVIDLRIKYSDRWRLGMKTDDLMRTPTVYALLDTMRKRFHKIEDESTMIMHDPFIEFIRVLNEIKTKRTAKRFDL